MNICVFGDSIAWGSCAKRGWVDMLKEYFYIPGGEEMQYTIFNLGIAANTSREILKRINKEAGARAPDMIIISIGINDAAFDHSKNEHWVSLKQYRKNLLKIIKVAQECAKKAIFIGLHIIDDSRADPAVFDKNLTYKTEYTKNYEKALEEVCVNHNIELIKTMDVFTKDDLFDGVHPNSQGHEKLFNKIYPEVEKILKEISN